jgi:cation transport regulator ChaC
MESGALAWMYLIDEHKIDSRERVYGGSWARFLAGECDEVVEEYNEEPDYSSDYYDNECDEDSDEDLDECDEVECDGECEECGACLDWSPEPTILYFAYGSNLDLEQMRRRCPESKLVGAGSLPGTRIAFAGHSRSWGGAVATIVPEKGAFCDGLVFACTPADIRALDACEGYPYCYNRARLTIEMDNGTVCKAWTYFLPLTRQEGAPSDAYLSQIWDAYLTNNFDLDRLIDAVEAA